MKVYQVIWTCRKMGVFPDIGVSLNTIAVSDGVLDNDIKELQNRFKIGVQYIDAVSIILDVPSYSFFKLKSGRYCICMAKDLPEKGDGFYCHGLIIEDGYLPFYPIQAVGSEVFRNGLNEYAKLDTLPILSNIPVGDVIDYQNTESFIKPRIEKGFKDMLKSVTQSSKYNRKVHILDTNNNLYLWIAAIQMSFPIGLAHSITFSTFPKYDEVYMILCHNLSNPIKPEEGSYIYDYRNNIISRFEKELTFTKIVCTSYMVSRATITEFHKFLGQFDYKEIDEDIEGAYNLFMLCSLGENSIEGSSFKEAFEFALNYASQDMLDYLIEVLDTSLDSIVRKTPLCAAGSISKFMFKAALTTKRLVLMEKICGFFYTLIDHLVIDYKEPDFDSIIDLYNDMIEFTEERAHAIYRYSINSDRIGYLVSILSKDCEVDKAKFYLDMTLRNLMELDYMWGQILAIDKMGIFMDMCINSIAGSEDYIESILRSVKDNDEYFVRVVVLFNNRIKYESVMKTFNETFAALLEEKQQDEGEDSAINIRKQISNLKCGRLILEEYKIELIKSSDRIVYFENYCSKIFDAIPGYAEQFFSEAVNFYMMSLPNDNNYGESIKILKGYIDNEYTLSKDALKSLIEAFECGIDLLYFDDEQLEMLPDIKRIKRNMEINTIPDITGLADFEIWLKKSGVSHTIDDIYEASLDLGSLDTRRYKNYITFCIPLIIDRVETIEDNRKLFRIFASDDSDEEFLENYIKTIENVLAYDRDKGKHMLLQFGVFFFFYLEPRYRMLEDEELSLKIKDSMVNIISKQPKSFIKEFNTDIKREFEKNGLSTPLQWNEIYKEIMTSSKPNLIDRLSNIFK